MKYPGLKYYDSGSDQWLRGAGRQLDYTYDAMGRPNTMTSPGNQTWIGGVTYNAAGQATNIGGEVRQYNFLGQLTRITSGTSFDERYDYPATANNGRITGKKNMLSGEEVVYAYDSLQRLTSAVTVGPEWGNTYGYDGFGNLVSAVVVKGTAPSLSFSIQASTNRVVGQSYDANGNMGWWGSEYDVDNRLWKSAEAVGAVPHYYGYDGSNKRVYKNRHLGQDGQENPLWDEALTFYGVGGERLGEYAVGFDPLWGGQHQMRFTEKKTLVWFGGKLLREGQWNVVQDRLGSVRVRRLAEWPWTEETADYYPYGGEKPSTTTQGREKFATYLRDETGLDYADQRYHWPDSGRFLTPDPYLASGGAGEPGSWNRYAYVGGDPVNYFDPSGEIALSADLNNILFRITVTAMTLRAGGGGGGGGGSAHIPQLEVPPDYQFSQQGGGTGSSILTVTDFSKTGLKQNVIWNTLSFMRAAFVDGIDPDCEKWLDGVVGRIGDLLGTTGRPEDSYVGHGVFSDPTVNAFNATGGTNVPVGAAAIVVNDNGAFFSSSQSTANGTIRGGTFQAQVFIMLHELGHSLDAKGFQPDRGNDAAGRANNDLVLQNCKRMLNWAK
jgi:RHS repeat-associated protein